MWNALFHLKYRIVSSKISWIAFASDGSPKLRAFLWAFLVIQIIYRGPSIITATMPAAKQYEELRIHHHQC